MPPEENKTQIPLEPTDQVDPASNGTGTPQQDSTQAESAVVETPALVEQPVKPEPVESPIDTIAEPVSAEQAKEETPTIEPPVEPTTTNPASPEERPLSAPLPEDSPPTPQSPAPTQTEPVQASPQPQIKTIEKIVYKTDPNIVQKLLIKARAKIQERKRKKLDKIMTLFEAKPQITNKDIQKLLRASRVSAFRYFNILEKQNRIKQVGNTGKSVFYTKI